MADVAAMARPEAMAAAGLGEETVPHVNRARRQASPAEGETAATAAKVAMGVTAAKEEKEGEAERRVTSILPTRLIITSATSTLRPLADQEDLGVPAAQVLCWEALPELGVSKAKGTQGLAARMPLMETPGGL